MMERLQLSEQEVVYYFDTFDAYDTENRGKIKIDGAEALFNQSGLPVGTLNKIIDLCGAHRFGYFGRIQFFMALKLISLAQSGYDVSLDALKAHGRDLPLPTFKSEVHPTSKCATAVNFESFSPIGANPNVTDLSDTAFGTSSEASTEFTTAKLGNTKPDLYSRKAKTHRILSDTAQNYPNNWIHFSDEEQPDPDEEDCSLLTNERVDRPDEFTLYDSTVPNHPSLNKDPFSISSAVRSKIQPTSPHLFISSPSCPPSTKTTPSPILHSHRSPPGTPFRELMDHNNQSPDQDWFYRPLGNGSSPTIHPNLSDQSAHSRREDHAIEMRYVERAKSTEDSTSPSVLSPTDGFRDLSASEPSSPKSMDRCWLSLFTLHPKEEAQYADQFDQVVDARRSGRRRLALTQTESRAVFLNQFNVTPTAFDKIWRLADMDRDNRLSKPEFCLAAHLAHLHGRQGLSLEQAVSATASYIADHLPWDLRHSLQMAYQDRHGPGLQDTSNLYQPLTCSPPSDVVPNGSISSHPSGAPQVYDHTVINHRIHTPTSSFIDLIDTLNSQQQNPVSSKCPGSLSLVACLRDEQLTSAPPRTVREHGEEVSDEDIAVIDGESEVETALLPDRILCMRRLRSPRSGASSSHSSKAGSDTEERFARLSPDRSSVTTSSSSSGSRTSSSEEEHVLTSLPTTSTAASNSSSSSGDSDSENEASDRNQNTLDPGCIFPNGKLNTRKSSKHRRVDPIQLLAVTTGRRPSKLAQYSSGRRRRVLRALIREAKSVNHTLLRLNNEMQGEWNELNDQRVNLSAQLRHLGLHPPN